MDGTLLAGYVALAGNAGEDAIGSVAALAPRVRDVHDVDDEEAGDGGAARGSRGRGGVKASQVDGVGLWADVKDVEALLHMQLATATPVAEAVCREAQRADPDGEDAGTIGVKRACGHDDEVTFGHGYAPPVLVADGIVGGCGSQRIDIIGEGAGNEGRARVCPKDVPGLRL